MVQWTNLQQIEKFVNRTRLYITWRVAPTVPLDLNFTYARAQKATARNIHGNVPEYIARLCSRVTRSCSRVTCSCS